MLAKSIALRRRPITRPPSPGIGIVNTATIGAGVAGATVAVLRAGATRRAAISARTGAEVGRHVPLSRIGIVTAPASIGRGRRSTTVLQLRGGATGISTASARAFRGIARDVPLLCVAIVATPASVGGGGSCAILILGGRAARRAAVPARTPRRIARDIPLLRVAIGTGPTTVGGGGGGAGPKEGASTGRAGVAQTAVVGAIHVKAAAVVVDVGGTATEVAALGGCGFCRRAVDVAYGRSIATLTGNASCLASGSTVSAATGAPDSRRPAVIVAAVAGL